MRALYNSLKAVADWLDIICEKLMTIGSIALFVTVMVQIIYRYCLARLFGYSMSFTDELSRYLMILVAYFGLSVCLTEGTHPGFEVIYKVPSALVRRIAHLFNRLLMLIFLGVVIIWGWQLLGQTWMSLSPSMMMPMWIIYGGIWIGAILGSFRLIIQMINDIWGFTVDPVDPKDPMIPTDTYGRFDNN